MFRPVTSRVNFPQLEESVLKLWRERNVFARSISAREGRTRFVFYEGPPTANGSPGIHHVLARAFKDIILRYRTMKGCYVPRIAGWDTHGLPVELEVEKKLGFSSKGDIEKYGIDNFNARCRENVFRYLEEWKAMTERIAFWLDLKHPYITMDNSYIETGWWAVKQMWDKGLIYRGYRVTPHCPRCGTSLSSHEVALGYKDDVEDPSIYIKFKLISKLPSGANPEVYRRLYTPLMPTYFLAWTTTPWTLPGNTALAVAPEADYAIVAVAVDGKKERLVLAEARLSCAIAGEYEILGRAKGRELVGLEYEPLFKPADFEIPSELLVPEHDVRAFASRESTPETYPVIGGDFVSMEEGTGIVHIAPAFGEIDYEVGKAQNLNRVQPVDLQGKITGSYPFAGLFVKKADPLIIADLKSRNLLYRSERIRHTYPFCWRCDTPLLYYAKQSWYIKTTAVKEALITGNKEINWYPEHIKYGRFGDWLQNNVDWAFSRERYWGTPLPVWRCQGCGHEECIGSVNELKSKSGLAGLKEPLDLHRPCLKDLHRPSVDNIILKCPGQPGSSHYPDKMYRVPEVIDCWFDSGAMPIAQYHYNFENDTLLEDGRFPADYICEAVDQTRGWFYSLHAISTLLFNRPSFKNVICLGHILDAKGEKMSKARGNVVDPWLIINKYGADALRWYCYTSSPPGNVRRFAESMVAEVPRRFLLTLWNVYSFFVTYANIDRFTPNGETGATTPSELDRWVISELNQLVADVDKALDGYDPTVAGRRIEAFVDELSTWYVRRSRRRFWKSENDADKLAAYNTLYQCLVTLAKLLAPFTPFVAEELYQNLVYAISPQAPDSVHLADFPMADTSKIDKQLAADVQLVMKVASLGRAARSQAGIKVRQPLDHSYVIKSPEIERALKSAAIKQSVLDELNIKYIKLATEAELAAMATKPDYAVDNIATASTAMYTRISPELAAEGMAREIVHRLQTMRRSAGFEIADYITTYYQGDGYVRQVITDFAGYIKQETLSHALIEGCPSEGAFSEKHKLAGHEIQLGVKRD